MTDDDLAPPAVAEVLPNWFSDGQPVTIEARGLSQFAGQSVSAVVAVLDGTETWQYAAIPIQIGADGSGSTVQQAGLSIGRHSAVFVACVDLDGLYYRLATVAISIANSPNPGTTDEHLMAQYHELEALQQALYEQPLGDPNGAGVVNHRALCVLEGLLMTRKIRLPGAVVRPIETRPADPERMKVINDLLADLHWSTRVPEDRWLQASRDRTPMTSIVCPTVWARDFDEAANLVRDVQEKLTGILALNRHATGRPVGLVIEQRQKPTGVKYRIFPPNESYTGNLIGGPISGESQRHTVVQYLGADRDPLARLCCELYAEALAERSVDARFLRLWSILEYLSGARIAAGVMVTLRDGKQWPGRHSDTSSAAPRVYHYLSDVIDQRRIDERSHVAPAPDLYEAVRVWYGRRNATGHYGRLVVGNATQVQQNWYQWAIRSAQQEQEWIGALTRTVELAINCELMTGAPDLP